MKIILLKEENHLYKKTDKMKRKPSKKKKKKKNWIKNLKFKKFKLIKESKKVDL